ncbi:MAG: ABC transporter ATP-binding protein [Candidatus Moraniibacteriota bacterium]|nr:MAG: ABC transporter ATP-binding protein [Candidatus Moranbacteria bacterium]
MSILSASHLSKTYSSGVRALDDLSLDIQSGEIFALLGPNGAGKTTFIGIIAGLVKKTSGSATIDGYDFERHWREARTRIGLVPQEIHLDIFLSAETILKNQRGFHGKRPNPRLVEKLLKEFSLFEKKDEEVRSLSGGMKRRVLIAKALVTEPKILFLDEPTAGVDVELRKDMWNTVKRLKDEGVTVILTTHYIEEAELLADRIGIINSGRLILVEEKQTLMKRMSEKTLDISLKNPLPRLPEHLSMLPLSLSSDGHTLTLRYSAGERNIPALLTELEKAGISVEDLSTQETSLEEIFINLTHKSETV